MMKRSGEVGVWEEGKNPICSGPAIEGRCVDGHTGCGPSNCACPGPAALDRLVLFLIHTYIHAAFVKP